MTLQERLAPKSGWYAVRCIFESNWPRPEPGESQVYEERITLWRADSADQAIELAESEAADYADAITETPSRYLGLAQSFALFDPPGQGAEVFSLMRSSELGADEYLDTFFSTGAEHAHDSN